MAQKILSPARGRGPRHRQGEAEGAGARAQMGQCRRPGVVKRLGLKGQAIASGPRLPGYGQSKLEAKAKMAEAYTRE